MIVRQAFGVDINRDFDAVNPDTIDPRIAPNDEIRGCMIARRRKAGLSDYPEKQLASRADADRILARSQAESPAREKVVAE